jgi:hypothetical protein
MSFKCHILLRASKFQGSQRKYIDNEIIIMFIWKLYGNGRELMKELHYNTLLQSEKDKND